jgi:hypothetical protein
MIVVNFVICMQKYHLFSINYIFIKIICKYYIIQYAESTYISKVVFRLVKKL